MLDGGPARVSRSTDRRTVYRPESVRQQLPSVVVFFSPVLRQVIAIYKQLAQTILRLRQPMHDLVLRLLRPPMLLVRQVQQEPFNLQKTPITTTMVTH